MAPCGSQSGAVRRDERRQNKPGGPGGSPPRKPPEHGGKGYSGDDRERRLEWELDDAMRRRLKTNGPLDEVLQTARALQDYRAANGITGRLDERFGKPFDVDERLVVDKLLSEGRNVSSIAALNTGDVTPDMVVDARLSEIKTSTSSNAGTFGRRVTRGFSVYSDHRS